VIPNEGRVAMLRSLCSDAMTLCLFTVGPAPDQEFASLGQFTPASGTTMRKLEYRDWRIDEERVEAAADKQTFAFSATGEKMLGYYLAGRRDQNLLAFEYFKDPVPINSTDDTVSVRPRIVLNKG
jgi:hypothetical protein